jgi:hypothetical protein
MEESPGRSSMREVGETSPAVLDALDRECVLGVYSRALRQWNNSVGPPFPGSTSCFPQPLAAPSCRESSAS